MTSNSQPQTRTHFQLSLPELLVSANARRQMSQSLTTKKPLVLVSSDRHTRSVDTA